MREFTSINEILDYAIEREQRAVDFYSGLAEKLTDAEMKKVFIQFSREEMGHKAKLTNIKENGMFTLEETKILDLKIADYTAKVTPKPDMTYQDALILAMQNEKSAFKLYTDLAAKAPNESIRSIFLSLAQEEAKHKLRFELEYDDNFLKEN